MLTLDDVAADATEEGVVMGLVARMERHCDGMRVTGPHPTRVGEFRGLRFEVECSRRGTRVRTLGAVILAPGGRAFAVLCAAPEHEYARARPAFTELLQTVRILRPVSAPVDPFEAARSVVGDTAGN